MFFSHMLVIQQQSPPEDSLRTINNLSRMGWAKVLGDFYRGTVEYV